MTDARVVRTRAALDRAVTELAATIPISAVTVSELAEAAGINRVTFYKHFESPSEALASTLEHDLRRTSVAEEGSPEPATQDSADEDPIDVFKNSIYTALDHLDRFKAVYQTQLSSRFDGVLHPVLTEYFADVIRSTSGDEAPNDAADARRSIAVYFIAHGIAGTVTGWLQNICMDREEMIATVLNRLPDDLFQHRV